MSSLSVTQEALIEMCWNAGFVRLQVPGTLICCTMGNKNYDKLLALHFPDFLVFFINSENMDFHVG